MSTTYQPPLVYDNYAVHGFPSTAAHVSRTRSAVNSNSQIPYPLPQPALVLPQASHPQVAPPRQSAMATTAQQPTAAPRSVRSATPSSDGARSNPLERNALQRDSETLIYHSLQIPKCISLTGGNLAEFAAQMTCLFWFESADELRSAENIRSRPPHSPIPRLPSLARPFEQFRKWVYSVLSTTQVTQNVILLALLFIYRLKMSTPQIKGRAGSEYRLLTVALMLGNKFLDDNTYTNKTWAEVSCFAVQEIHVMEVEFLSNMRYNLSASAKEWDEWLLKLACFHEYYERALRLPASPVHVPSPTSKLSISPLPSPTATQPPLGFDLSPSSQGALASGAPNMQPWAGYQPNTVSPLATKPVTTLPPSRKRTSQEEDAAEHPAKRTAPNRALQPSDSGPVVSTVHVPGDISRLPVPRLSVVTNPSNTDRGLPTTPTGYAPQLQASTPSRMSLPPLQSGIRAMATVFQPTPPAAMQQPAASMSSAPGTIPATLPSQAQAGFGTPTKPHPPGSLGPLPPYSSSPLAEHFASNSAVHTPLAHTPIANSPSFYLQQRASPYRPIRHVNRLLYPPPSASLDQYHLSVPLPPTQMHYQPLGRRNDVRTGVVPEFIVYNQGQQQMLTPQSVPQAHYPT